MKIIEVNKLSNGAHRNQAGELQIVPEGWAVVPETLKTENFPFGDIEAEEIDEVMTVTKWIPLEIPEKEEPEKVFIPTIQDDIDKMLIDQEYRLTLLELGVTE